MGVIINFPVHPMPHDSAINRLFAKVDKLMQRDFMEMVCGMFIVPAGDETGERAAPCSRPTDFNCLRCGPICICCRTEYACPGTDGMHTRDSVEPEGPEVA